MNFTEALEGLGVAFAEKRQADFDAMPLRSRLHTAFMAMRKLRLIARQNYLCCSGCAGSAIANTVTEKIDAGADKDSIAGCVFYHGQDANNLKDGDNFYVAFGSIHTEKYGAIGHSTVEVGHMAMKAFKDAGVPAEWDGSENTRIMIRQVSNDT